MTPEIVAAVRNLARELNRYQLGYNFDPAMGQCNAILRAFGQAPLVMPVWQELSAQELGTFVGWLLETLLQQGSRVPPAARSVMNALMVGVFLDTPLIRGVTRQMAGLVRRLARDLPVDLLEEPELWGLTLDDRMAMVLQLGRLTVCGSAQLDPPVLAGLNQALDPWWQRVAEILLAQKAAVSPASPEVLMASPQLYSSSSPEQILLTMLDSLVEKSRVATLAMPDLWLGVPPKDILNQTVLNYRVGRIHSPGILHRLVASPLEPHYFLWFLQEAAAILRNPSLRMVILGGGDAILSCHILALMARQLPHLHCVNIDFGLPLTRVEVSTLVTFSPPGYAIAHHPGTPHIHHAVVGRDMEKRPAEVSTRPYLLTASNALDQRLSDTFLRQIIAPVLREHPELDYRIVGSSQHVESKMSLLRETGVAELESRVQWLGTQDNSKVQALLSGAALYVNEYPDGGGYIIIESLAQGCPAICMHAGAAHCQHIGYDYTFPPGQVRSVEEYLLQVRRMLAEPGEYRRQARAYYEARYTTRQMQEDLWQHVFGPVLTPQRN